MFVKWKEEHKVFWVERKYDKLISVGSQRIAKPIVDSSAYRAIILHPFQQKRYIYWRKWIEHFVSCKNTIDVFSQWILDQRVCHLLFPPSYLMFQDKTFIGELLEIEIGIESIQIEACNYMMILPNYIICSPSSTLLCWFVFFPFFLAFLLCDASTNMCEGWTPR